MGGLPFRGRTEVRREVALAVVWGSFRSKPVQPCKFVTPPEGLPCGFCRLGAEQKCGEKWLWLLRGELSAANLGLYGGRDTV